MATQRDKVGSQRAEMYLSVWLVNMLAADEALSSHSIIEVCALDSFLVPGYLGEQRLSLGHHR